jgi:hypothetical protein
VASPAASPTPSWGILKSGLAYFFGLVLAGGTITGPDYIINSAGIFIFSGTPGPGNLIGSWAGAPGTILGNTYPAGFNITVGAISGATITGSTIDGSNIVFPNGVLSNGDGQYTNQPGIFFFSPTPGPGNLVYSDAVSSGQDIFGNTFIGNGPCNYNNGAGVAQGTLNGIFISWFSMTAQPGAVFTPLANISYATSPGSNGLKLAVGSDGLFISDTNSSGLDIWHVAATTNIAQLDIGDGNLYTSGEKQFSAQAIGVPSNVAFTGFLTFPVKAGITYDLYVRILYSGNQNAGAPIIGWHGGTLGPGLPAGYGYTHFNWVQNAVYNNASAGDRTGPTLSTGALIYETRHRFAATGTGTFGIAGACSIAGDTWNMLGCDLVLRPIR